MATFQPFSYGDVVSQGEAIKSARLQNQLLQQEQDPNSIRNQLLREQLSGARQGNVLAQKQEERVSTQYGQQQEIERLKMLNAASAQVSADPSAINYWGPKLKQAGALPPDYDYSKETPEAIMKGAQTIYESTSKALGLDKQKAEGPAAVQEYGFFQTLTPENKKVFMDIKRAAPGAKFTDMGDVVMVSDPVTAEPIRTIKKGIAPEQRPEFQGRAAEAKAAGAEIGKAKTEAAINLPQAIDSAQYMVKLLDDIVMHPGLKQAVGASSMLGVQKIPGTPAADFARRLDQIQGGQFLQAFESLKGGGAITEIEGKRATDAISRMSTSQSEKEFVRAAKEFKGIVMQGLARSKAKAGVSGGAPSQQNVPQTSIDDLVKKYAK